MQALESPRIKTSSMQESVKSNEKESLKLERHRMALEKLQLSWMNKTLALSALGFTAYRFYNSRIEAGKLPLFEPFNGRYLGIFLVSLGILGLLQASIQHARKYRALRNQHRGLGYSVALVQSVILLVLFFVTLNIIILKF